MMNAPEHDDPVWDLLKKARKVEPSPSFVRNVVREARRQESARTSGAAGLFAEFFAWLSRPVVAVPAGALAALLVAGVIFYSNSRVTSPSPSSFADNTPEETLTVPDASPAAPLSPSQGSKEGPASTLASDLETISYLGELMAVNDPSALDDDALANLLF